MSVSLVVLVAVAAVWGAGTSLLIPRIAYRLAVEPDEDWRTACPAGHPLTGPLGGWLGRARCTGGAAEPPGTVGPLGMAGPLGTAAPAGTVEPLGPVKSTGAAGTGAGTDAGAGTGACAGTGAGAGTEAVVVHGRYGPRTGTVVAVTVLVCLALAAATGARPEVAVWLLAAPVGVLLAVVDHQVQRLPDILTLPLAAGTAVLLGLAALLPGHAGSWPAALLGLAALGAGYFVLFLVNPKGIGFGDVKLALALGAALGWYGWVVLALGFVLGLGLGGGYGLTLIVLRRAGRKSSIPLGPFLLTGAFLGVLLGAV